jgi:hypothetical protein
MHKGSTQTNKKIKLGFKRKEQKKPKSTMVWRTGLSGVPPDSVRCTRPYNSELFSFGFLRPRSAIIHRTVRCATGLSGAPAEQRLASATVACKRYSARTVRAEVRVTARGAPDSEQYLSGAAPDCPVLSEDKDPAVKTVRTLTVG